MGEIQEIKGAVRSEGNRGILGGGDKTREHILYESARGHSGGKGIQKGSGQEASEEQRRIQQHERHMKTP